MWMFYRYLFKYSLSFIPSAFFDSFFLQAKDFNMSLNSASQMTGTTRLSLRQFLL